MFSCVPVYEHDSFVRDAAHWKELSSTSSSFVTVGQYAGELGHSIDCHPCYTPSNKLSQYTLWSIHHYFGCVRRRKHLV